MHANITQHDKDSGGHFAFTDKGKEVGGMYYSYSEDGKLIIDHTEVDEEYEGKGIARQLLEALVNFARQKSLKVLPHCSYAAAAFKRAEEWQDVLA